MAKSLRSKFKKANKITKRAKNSKRELKKLEKLTEMAKEASASQEQKKVYTVLGATSDDAAEPAVETTMAVDGEEEKPELSKEAARAKEINEMPMNTAPKNAHGQYPVWMNSRAVKRAKKAEKNKIIKRKRSVKSKSKPWR